MMHALDTLIDTRKKRKVLLCLLAFVLMSVVLVTYLVLGLRLLMLEEYQDVFSLLQRPEIEWTFLSRIVLSLVQVGTIQAADIISSVVSAIRLWEVMTIIIWCGMLQLKEPLLKKGCTFLKILFLGSAAIVICLLVIGFQSTTLLGVVYALKSLGFVLTCFALSSSMICLYEIFYRLLPAYREALSYTAEEIVKD